MLITHPLYGSTKWVFYLMLTKWGLTIEHILAEPQLLRFIFIHNFVAFSGCE